MEARANNSHGGFTLLELLVVLSIGAAMMVYGVPAFQTIVADQRSTATANEMIESMILARSEAIKRGRYVSVCRSKNGKSCTPAADWNDGWIIFANDSAATPAVRNPNDEILRVYQALPDSLSIDTLGNIGTFISFRPVGTTGTTVLNFFGTLVLCEDNGFTGPRALVIQPSGRIQISREVDHLDQPLGCA